LHKGVGIVEIEVPILSGEPVVGKSLCNRGVANNGGLKAGQFLREEEKEEDFLEQKQKQTNKSK